jgi:hypothetical protein
VALSAASLVFAPQLVSSTSTAQSITLTNSGNATLKITSIAITGANATDFAQSNTCGATLAAAASCTISAAFKPAAIGNRSAAVSITNNADGSPQTVALTGSGSDFSVENAGGGSGSATIAAGQSTSYNLQIQPLGGFNGAVSLTCTGAPALATCTLLPSSAVMNGSAPSVFTATVTTTASSTGPVLRFPRTGSPIVLLVCLELVLLAFASYRSQARSATRLPRRGFGLASALLLIGLIWLATSFGGCSSVGTRTDAGSGSVTHSAGTPKGTYALTITGSSGGVTHTQNLTLTVN